MNHTSLEGVSGPPHTVCLAVEYAGEQFFGVQKQANCRTVLGDLELGLASVLGHVPSVSAAGRTDAGVHATRQIVAFSTCAERPESAFIYGANARLKGVKIRSACVMPEGFHPRYSAQSRRYVYVLYRGPVLPIHWQLKAVSVPKSLDAGRVHEAAQCLLGTHDFSAFRAAGCQSRSSIREVHAVACYERGDFLCISIEANAFLYRMVRKIVHSLCLVGTQRWSQEQFLDVFRSGQGVRTAPMPPQGLYLTNVLYPECYHQANRSAPCWLETWMLGG